MASDIFNLRPSGLQYLAPVLFASFSSSSLDGLPSLTEIIKRYNYLSITHASGNKCILHSIFIQWRSQRRVGGQTSSSCVFQVRYKLHQQNVSDGLAQKADLKKYLAATMTKERESAALAPMNISLRKLHGLSPPIDTFARKHP